MEQEKQPLKVYYSIGEVADMFGVNTSLIRFWEKEFDVIKPHKNKKGNRQFTKADIRAVSRYLDLPTWEKQSFACLSSRFVYGETITEEKLGMVDKAEQLLLDMGFHQVRVRIHGMMARIEIEPSEFSKLMEEENRKFIAEKFKEYGFTYVTLDLLGYRMGSMNETLGLNKETK